MNFKKSFNTILITIVTTVTTATLDWGFSKVTHSRVDIPIVTPYGTFKQTIEFSERRGLISGYQWDSETNLVKQ